MRKKKVKKKEKKKVEMERIKQLDELGGGKEGCWESL